MKQIFWVLLLIPLMQACATHAPMSEMVMFNSQVGEEKINKAAIGVSIGSDGISDEYHMEKNIGDYRYDILIEDPITLDVLRFEQDDWAVHVAYLHTLGVDATKKLDEDIYGTLSLSANSSIRALLHIRLINDQNMGLAMGPFFGIDSRSYYDRDVCYDDPCGSYELGPDEVSYLRNAGLRSRFLLRTSKRPAVIITGAIEYGYLFEVSETFVGITFSLTSF